MVYETKTPFLYREHFLTPSLGYCSSPCSAMSRTVRLWPSQFTRLPGELASWDWGFPLLLGGEGLHLISGSHDTGSFFTPAVGILTCLGQLAFQDNSCKLLAPQIQTANPNSDAYAFHHWESISFMFALSKGELARSDVLLTETQLCSDTWLISPWDDRRMEGLCLIFLAILVL